MELNKIEEVVNRYTTSTNKDLKKDFEAIINYINKNCTDTSTVSQLQDKAIINYVEKSRKLGIRTIDFTKGANVSDILKGKELLLRWQDGDNMAIDEFDALYKSSNVITKVALYSYRRTAEWKKNKQKSLQDKYITTHQQPFAVDDYDYSYEKVNNAFQKCWTVVEVLDKASEVATKYYDWCDAIKEPKKKRYLTYMVEHRLTELSNIQFFQHKDCGFGERTMFLSPHYTDDKGYSHGGIGCFKAILHRCYELITCCTNEDEYKDAVGKIARGIGFIDSYSLLSDENATILLDRIGLMRDAINDGFSYSEAAQFLIEP